MTAEKVKRKLTAILSADVKGYSRLMGADEVGTIRTLETYRRVISDLIQKKGGRVVDSPGDNVLAEFASVVDALESAVEMQKELKVRNADRSESRRMEFRIGINLGDVVEEGERIYGDGVNIAARIEGLAEGGGICISGTAFDHLGKRLPLGYEYMGEREVKNIEKPVRVYRVLMEPEQAGKVIGEKGPRRTQWRWAVAAAVVLVAVAFAFWNFYFRPPPIEPASTEKMAFPLPDKPSIAVLPFVNMSGDSGQEFLSDGITENIITGLSQVNALFVIARNSTFTYKGKPVKVQQVAENLGVRYVLEGSVQRSGERLRITAQFIDALKGHHLWSERYDRELKDLFAIEDDITKKIITALQVILTQGEQARLYARGTENLEAYLKAMEAREQAFLFNKVANTLARQKAAEAISLDPGYSYAYGILGKTYIGEVFFGWSPSPKEAMRRASEWANKALALDEFSFQAHTTLAYVHLLKREHDAAVRESERAAELAPNAADSFFNLGIILRFAGRAKDAVGAFERAIRLNPIPPASYLYQLALSYTFVGEFEKAVRLCKEALSKNPDDLVGRVTLIVAYGSLGREQEAKAQVSELLRVDPKFSLEQAARTWPYKNDADRELVLTALRKAGLPDKPPLPLPDKPSIAVLPFVNMSDDKSQEYFSDGLTEEIITALSKVRGLFVIARNSSFVYKGKPVNVQQVGGELGVKYLLEGSVRRSGDQLRITAQLIDATTGNHLWAERYDREMKDIFAIQDEITMKIVGSCLQLTTAEMGTLRGRYPSNLQAYLNLLEGIGYNYRAKFSDAMRSFEEALSLDPHYPPTYAWLAWTHMWNVWFSPSATRAQSLEKAFQFAEKAKALDDKSFAGPNALGHAYLLKRDYDKALSEGKLATELAPNSAVAATNFGWTLRSVGRYEEAMKEYERAVRLDPLNTDHTLTQMGTTYLMMRRYEESISACRKALQGNPRFLAAHITLAMAYSSLGNMEEAQEASSEVLKLSPNFSVEHFAKALPYKDEADREFMADALRKAGLK